MPIDPGPLAAPEDHVQFYNPNALMQPVTAQPAPGAGGPMSPLSAQQSQDPRSQMLAAAMASMGRTQQGSPTGLGENLMADALDQYALQQRNQQLQGGNVAAPSTTPGTSAAWGDTGGS